MGLEPRRGVAAAISESFAKPSASPSVAEANENYAKRSRVFPALWLRGGFLGFETAASVSLKLAEAANHSSAEASRAGLVPFLTLILMLLVAMALALVLAVLWAIHRWLRS